jgi:hypothetical protein
MSEGLNTVGQQILAPDRSRDCKYGRTITASSLLTLRQKYRGLPWGKRRFTLNYVLVGKQSTMSSLHIGSTGTMSSLHIGEGSAMGSGRPAELWNNLA